MWFTYPAEDNPLAHIPSVLFLLEEDDMIHYIPVGKFQATGIPSEVHWDGMEGFGDGGCAGRVVTPGRTDTPGSTPLGFPKGIDRIFDRGEERGREMGTLCGLYLSLSGAEEEDLGRIRHNLDQTFHLLTRVPCEIFLF
jgi:hypothetical protein